MYLSRLVALVALAGAVTPRRWQRREFPGGPVVNPRRSTRAPIHGRQPLRVRAGRFGAGGGDRDRHAGTDEGRRGRDYTVIEQAQMNDALTQYGYPKDAILSPALAVTLAKNIQARFLVNSTISKGGRDFVTPSRPLTGTNDDAGNLVTLTQNPGETPEAFGKRLASRSQPAVESPRRGQGLHRAAQEQARQGRRGGPEGDQDAARPRAGELSPGPLAQDKKAPGRDDQGAPGRVQGRPAEPPGLDRPGHAVQQAHDTANTLVAFKQMLRVAPTNQKLREELFKYFLQTGHPETALEVAD